MNAIGGARQILIHGIIFVLAGMVWGLVVPHTPFPRLALSAHIGFEGSGLLFLALAVLLLCLPHRVGRKSIAVMLLAVWLTWIMILSEVANAWWGTVQILPIAAHQAGATGGTPAQELIVKLAHMVAGSAQILAWALLLIGFARPPIGDSGNK